MHERHVAAQRRQRAGADRLAQPQHHLDDVAHRQPPDRAPLRGGNAGTNLTAPCAARGACSTPSGSVISAARARRRDGVPPRAPRAATSTPAPPPQRTPVTTVAEAKRARDARDRRREMLQQAVVTVAHAVQRDRPLSASVASACWTRLRAETRVASEALNPSTKPITIAPRLRRQAPREFAPPQQVRHADVFVRQTVEHGHRLPPTAVSEPPTPPRRARSWRCGWTPRRAPRRRQRLHEVRRPAVHELGARLDGGGPARQPPRVDAAADARARFEHDHAQPRTDAAGGPLPGPRRPRRRR